MNKPTMKKVFESFCDALANEKWAGAIMLINVALVIEKGKPVSGMEHELDILRKTEEPK